MALKNIGKRNSFQWAVLWLVYLVIYFVYKEKVTHIWNVYRLIGCGKWPGKPVKGCGGICIDTGVIKC